MEKIFSTELTTIKRNICTLIIVLSMNFGNAFAHSDLFYNNNFGNVKTSILTGFQYEEINKVAIFGQLAEKLSKEFNYFDPILLDFTHTYTHSEISDSFISYDSISYWDADSESWLVNKGIVIRQIAKEFQAQPILKLLEYAILNLETIKSTQKQMVYNPYPSLSNYERKINTIDTLAIEQILNASNSDLLNNVLKQRVDRPEKEGIDRPEGDFRHGGISYYWQNNRYFVFFKYDSWYDNLNQKYVNEKREVVLFDVGNIYDFRRFRNWSALIFDTDTSFYSIKQHVNTPFGLGQHTLEDKPKISKRQVIENTSGYWLWRPFQIESIGGDKVSITLQSSNWDRPYRTLLHLVDEDRLIQDLDELVRE
jgi:hypothetical protein